MSAEHPFGQGLNTVTHLAESDPVTELEDQVHGLSLNESAWPENSGQADGAIVSTNTRSAKSARDRKKGSNGGIKKRYPVPERTLDCWRVHLDHWLKNRKSAETADGLQCSNDRLA